MLIRPAGKEELAFALTRTVDSRSTLGNRYLRLNIVTELVNLVFPSGLERFLSNLLL